MLIRKDFKFEIYPNDEQVRKMNQFCGFFRFLYNQGLAFQKENRFKDYEKIRKLRSYYLYLNFTGLWIERSYYISDKTNKKKSKKLGIKFPRIIISSYIFKINICNTSI